MATIIKSLSEALLLTKLAMSTALIKMLANTSCVDNVLAAIDLVDDKLPFLNCPPMEARRYTTF